MNKEYSAIYELIKKYETMLSKRLAGKTIKAKDGESGKWYIVKNVILVRVKPGMYGKFKIEVKGENHIFTLDENAEIQYQ